MPTCLGLDTGRWVSALRTDARRAPLGLEFPRGPGASHAEGQKNNDVGARTPGQKQWFNPQDRLSPSLQFLLTSFRALESCFHLPRPEHSPLEAPGSCCTCRDSVGKFLAEEGEGEGPSLL
ncbi:Alsin [Manis pentadactyla]|nr:Alsin [Manis pentadactyla]